MAGNQGDFIGGQVRGDRCGIEGREPGQQVDDGGDVGFVDCGGHGGGLRLKIIANGSRCPVGFVNGRF